MLGGRQRSESACDLLCFRDCDNSYEQLVTRNEVDISKPQKLSLKKVLQNESGLPQKVYINSNSQKNLDKRRSQTNRSNKSKKEFQLFKKKQQIENQIMEVDKQMSKLTFKYQSKIKQLKNVRKQLEKIKQH